MRVLTNRYLSGTPSDVTPQGNHRTGIGSCCRIDPCPDHWRFGLTSLSSPTRPASELSSMSGKGMPCASAAPTFGSSTAARRPSSWSCQTRTRHSLVAPLGIASQCPGRGDDFGHGETPPNAPPFPCRSARQHWPAARSGLARRLPISVGGSDLGRPPRVIAWFDTSPRNSNDAVPGSRPDGNLCVARSGTSARSRSPPPVGPIIMANPHCVLPQYLSDGALVVS